MTEAMHKTRRRHSAELKQQILAECARPGASVASVALSHGINANVVHKWRRLAHGPSLDLPVPTFVPVALPAPSCVPAPDIRIELRRGATCVSLTWPVSAAEHCAAWMGDRMRGFAGHMDEKTRFYVLDSAHHFTSRFHLDGQFKLQRLSGKHQ